MSHFIYVVVPGREPVAGTYIIREVQSYWQWIIHAAQNRGGEKREVAVTKVIKKCEKTHFIKESVSP